VWAHGYVQWGGAKVSKSSGGTLSVDEAIDYHGADALRYFQLREVGFENDGDFTWERFDARYGSELADTFGNLVKRSLDMIHRYRGGTVPGDPRGYRTPLEDAAQSALAAYRRAMDGFRLEEGAARWMELAARANRYIEETTPWNLAKQGHDAELDSVLANLARTVARLAVLALPFVPATAGSVWALLGAAPQPPQPLDRARLADLATLDLAGRHIQKPPILFPKPKLAPA